MNTFSKNVRQLGRKQEHFRRIRKLKLQLLRVNANSVWKNFSVVNANAKILGQSDNFFPTFLFTGRSLTLHTVLIFYLHAYTTYNT